ncbi:hypothetical protein DVA67_010240 [Solirubrobacter sp. CPCC 204708]|uniref:Uncharacterized protein n=1 Tax=Solirubrobacter deserti TaxID=2282478 RepID=A0ABT4RU54_9ACTN|nr:hypothetical protein [Solirubrobacter deserti]MBE2316356.1 hypothetical protein [Solirubrobacter deserti]MDA0142113.1 hypothetical protein [Solirubrobacter deserti]
MTTLTNPRRAALLAALLMTFAVLALGRTATPADAATPTCSKPVGLTLASGSKLFIHDDDSSFLYSGADEATFNLSGIAVKPLGCGTTRTTHFERCVDEVRVETDIKVQRPAVATADLIVDVYSTLYEGVTCATEDKDGTMHARYYVSPGDDFHGWFTTYNEDELSGDVGRTELLMRSDVLA